MWSSIICWFRKLFSGMEVYLPLIVPAFAGAVLGTLRGNRRRSTRAWIGRIVMCALSGLLFAPLFNHVFGIPDAVAVSAASFLAFVGVDGLDGIWRALKARGGVVDEQEPAEKIFPEDVSSPDSQPGDQSISEKDNKDQGQD